jgi:hypothetical protein
MVAARQMSTRNDTDGKLIWAGVANNFDAIPWHIIYDMFSIPNWMPYPHRRRAMQSRDFLHRDIRRIVESVTL